jgi:Transposase DDE domain
MAEKLCAAGHQGPYRLRKQVVESVSGQIKQARLPSIRRGLAWVQGEWGLICAVHNLLKLVAAYSSITLDSSNRIGHIKSKKPSASRQPNHRTAQPRRHLPHTRPTQPFSPLIASVLLAISRTGS